MSLSWEKEADPKSHSLRQTLDSFTNMLSGLISA